MYASPEARDADIDELAAAAPDELRERFLAATGRFGEALEAMHEADWDGPVRAHARRTRLRAAPTSC